MEEPLVFIKKVNQEHGDFPQRLQIYPRVNDKGEIYAIDMRFSRHQFSSVNEDTFERLKIGILHRTDYTLLVTTSFSDFRTGVMNFVVTTCNINYDPGLTTLGLNYLINTAFPAIRDYPLQTA